MLIRLALHYELCLVPASFSDRDGSTMHVSRSSRAYSRDSHFKIKVFELTTCKPRDSPAINFAVIPLTFMGCELTTWVFNLSSFEFKLS